MITLDNIIPRMPDSPFIQPINWQINNDEVWGVVGRNGSGKSLLSELVCGKIAVQSGNLRYHFLEDPDKSTGNRLPSQQIKKDRVQCRLYPTRLPEAVLPATVQ